MKIVILSIFNNIPTCNPSIKASVVALSIACFLVLSCRAQVTLPSLVSDGMILQRDRPIQLWGWAAPGEVITIKCFNKTFIAQTGMDKKWKITIPRQSAGGPYEMNIKASNEITVKNILIGDVWICSGQSNMEMQMAKVTSKYPEEIANAANPQIRQFAVHKSWGFNVMDSISGSWKEATPQNVLNFTAVGYFYALALYQKYKIPIGLINTSYGGTPVEGWTSEQGLEAFPAYLKAARRFKDSVQVKAVQKKNKDLTDSWYAKVNETDKGLTNTADLWTSINHKTSSWLTMRLPNFWDNHGLKETYGIVYFRKEIEIAPADTGKDAVLNLGMIDDQDTTYFNGKKIGFGITKSQPRVYTVPGSLIKSGRNIIIIRVLNTDGNGGFMPGSPTPYQFVIGGTVIPLSGEWQYQVGTSVPALSPASLTSLYQQPTAMYNTMVAPLIPYSIKGVIWYQGENNTKNAIEYRILFPNMIIDWRSKWQQKDLPFIFVQLTAFGGTNQQPSESDWATLRESQFKTLSTPATAMVVTHDIGDANNIHPLDKKDVGIRLSLAAEKIAYGDSSVIYTAPSFAGMKIEGNKIVLSFKNVESGLVAKNGDLRLFAIAGNDQKFVWAQAKILGDKIFVWSDSVSYPVAVRYAWANNPENANLFNSTGLPVSSFRTDDWAPVPVFK